MDNTAIHVPAYGAPLEHAITRALIDAMDAAGFVPVAVWDSEEYVFAGDLRKDIDTGFNPSEPMTPAGVLDAVFAVDANPTIHFAPRGKLTHWGAFGVLVIQGNGIDFVSDWHVRREVPAWDKALNAFSDALHARDGYVLTISVRK